MGLFRSEKTNTLEPLLTPEQQEAQRLLLNLGRTGRIGNFQAGQPYTGSFGQFRPTDVEQSAVARVSDLLSAGTPESLNRAEDTFTRLSDTEFDPSDPASGFAAYQRQLARATKGADDVINREAAITGNRFGDRIQRSKIDLAERQSDLLGTKLSDLYNTAQSRALQGAQGLSSIAGLKDQIALNRAGAAANIGSLSRMLETAEAQAQYNDFLRGRDERLGTINSVNSVWQRSVPYGKISNTTSSATPLGQLLNVALTAGGTAVGGAVGGPIGASIGGMLGSTAGGALSGTDNSAVSGSLMQLLGNNLANSPAMSSGNVSGTGVFGTRLGGVTQSELLGVDTRKYRG